MNTNPEQYANALAFLRHTERAAHEAKLTVKALNGWEPMRGAEFRVIRGRKFPIGTVARADFIGTNDFGGYIRFTLDGETKFIAERNVEWPEYEIRRESALTAMNAAEAAVREARDTVVKLSGLDLTKPTGRGKLSQHAYSDSYVAEYACNPDAPDDLLRAALDVLDPPQSSWGALRWSQGSSISSRNGGIVSITSHTGICD